MKTIRKVKKLGGSLILVIPPDYAKYLDIEDDVEVFLQDDEGKHGKFLSVWRKDQQCQQQ